MTVTLTIPTPFANHIVEVAFRRRPSMAPLSNVTRLGARAEYHFSATRPRDGAEKVASDDPLLNRYLHLAVMNRGVLMTPFHNMALMSPATVAADVDRHTEVFDDVVAALVS